MDLKLFSGTLGEVISYIRPCKVAANSCCYFSLYSGFKSVSNFYAMPSNNYNNVFSNKQLINSMRTRSISEIDLYADIGNCLIKRTLY